MLLGVVPLAHKSMKHLSGNQQEDLKYLLTLRTHHGSI